MVNVTHFERIRIPKGLARREQVGRIAIDQLVTVEFVAAKKAACIPQNNDGPRRPSLNLPLEGSTVKSNGTRSPLFLAIPASSVTACDGAGHSADYVGVQIDADVALGRPLQPEDSPAAQERLNVDPVRGHQVDDPLVNS